MMIVWVGQRVFTLQYYLLLLTYCWPLESRMGEVDGKNLPGNSIITVCRWYGMKESSSRMF